MRTLVLHFVLEAAELAQALDCGRQEAKHERSRDSGNGASQTIHHCLRRMFRAFALRVPGQSGIDNSAIRRAVAGDGKNVFDFRHLAHDRAHLVLNIPDVIPGRAGRSLDDDREITLVLVWDKTGGHTLENQNGEAQSREKQNHGDHAEAKKNIQ